MLETYTKHVASLVTGKPNRLIGSDRTARVYVRALRGGFGREGSHGPPHAATLMWAQLALLRGEHDLN